MEHFQNIYMHNSLKCKITVGWFFYIAWISLDLLMLESQNVPLIWINQTILIILQVKGTLLEKKMTYNWLPLPVVYILHISVLSIDLETFKNKHILLSVYISVILTPYHIMLVQMCTWWITDQYGWNICWLLCH